MRIARSPLFLTAAAAALVLLTLKLAFWQFDRAAQKGALEQAAAAAMRSPARPLTAPHQITPFQRALLAGQYLPAGEILLDNRVYQRRAGYHVLTPFTLETGEAVMVNRGWLAGDGRRRAPAIPPPPSGRVTIQGFFYADSADAFSLSDAPETGLVRQRLDLAALAAENGLALLSLALLKEAAADDPLPAPPLRTDYKSAQSIVYAWQWLTFCLLTLVFYALLMKKRRR